MGISGAFKGGISNSGIILHYDAGKIQSYSKSGTIVNDLSDSATTGGLTSSTIRWSNSNGGIIIFDGTTTKINIGTPTNLQFNNTQPFSISVWFKWTEASASVGNLVAYVTAPPSATGWYLGLDRSGAVGTNIAFFDFAASAASYRGIYTTTNSIIQNAWMNVVATNDSSNSAAGMKIYINGTLASTSVRSSQTPATPSYAGITAQVGARASDATYAFEGNISQVLIYNRELSASEVLQNYTNFRSRISLRGIDSDADSFLKAAHIEDSTQANAVNNLVLDLKKFGLWTKMKAIYPIVGGNAWAHAVNLKTPGTYNLTFFGTWTHASTGMTPTTTYADTGFNMSTISTNNHISIYIRTNSNESSSNVMGAATSANVSVISIGPRQSNITYMQNQVNNSFSSIADTSSSAFYLNSRLNTSAFKGYKNGNTLFTDVGGLGNSIPFNMYIGSRNVAGVSTFPTSRQSAFASIGDGLTDTEAANFYTAVQTFQTALGRQV